MYFDIVPWTSEGKEEKAGWWESGRWKHLVTIVVCLEGQSIVAPLCPLKLLAQSTSVLLTLAVQSA